MMERGGIVQDGAYSELALAEGPFKELLVISNGDHADDADEGERRPATV